MIHFQVYLLQDSGSMMVQPHCKWLPDCFKTPVKVKDQDLPEYKERITKLILFMLAERMLNQRLQNYNHSGLRTNISLKLYKKLDKN